MRKILFTLIVIFACCTVDGQCILASESLTTDEINAIEEYIANTPVESGVGQLLIVGLPVDLSNYVNNKNLNKIISDIGIGNFFMNNYNYTNIETNKHYVLDIINFHNKIQAMVNETSNIPALLMADFEGPRFSSLRDNVIAPLPALTIACSDNHELIEMNGYYSGCVLRSLGIHAITGPVLDLDNTSAGFQTNSGSVIGNRSFGSDVFLIEKFASHYLNGLNKAGVLAIGKHYPGHGFVSSNPHDYKNIPKFNGNFEILKSQIEPFRIFSKYLQGIMTSHMQMSFLTPCNSDIITTSKTFVNDIIRKNDQIFIENNNIFGLDYNGIIMTDDLGNTGTILYYMKENKISFPQLALDAFIAGHDLLLFSHVDIDTNMRKAKFGRYGLFDINELKKVKDYLVDKIKTSAHLMERYKESLRRVLTIKSIINKTYYSDAIFKIGTRKIIWNDGYPDDKNGFGAIKNSKYKDIEAFFHQALNNSAIILSYKIPYNILELGRDNHIIFCSPKECLYIFKNEFINRYKKCQFIEIPDIKKVKTIKRDVTVLSKALAECDRFIYIMQNIDDANILHRLLMENKKAFENKSIIFVHNTPSIIPTEILLSSTTIGCFTKHPFSYETDIDILNGIIKPKEIKKLPINLGTNREYYQADYTRFVTMPAEEYIFPDKPFISIHDLREQNNRLRISNEWLQKDSIKKANTIEELTKYKETDERQNNPKNNYTKHMYLLNVIIFTIAFIFLYFYQRSDIRRIVMSKAREDTFSAKIPFEAILKIMPTSIPSFVILICRYIFLSKENVLSRACFVLVIIGIISNLFLYIKEIGVI